MPPVCRQARVYSCSSRRSRPLLVSVSDWLIWSAVDLTRESMSGSASLRQQVRSITPMVFPDSGSRSGTPAQAIPSSRSA